MLYNFGRADKLDLAAMDRLAASITRFTGTATAATTTPTTATATTEPGGQSPAVSGQVSFIRDLGGVYALNKLWSRLGIDTIIVELADHAHPDPGPGRPLNTTVLERILFGLVASRALAPSSKLAACHWMTDVAALPGVDDGVREHINPDACYRAMDFLSTHAEQFARAVFDATVDRLNERVDIVFFDTTSTYFETETPDQPVWRTQTGTRAPQPDHDTTTATPPGDTSPQASVQTPAQASEGAVGSTQDQTQPDGVLDQAARCGSFRCFGHSKDSRADLPQIIIGVAVTRQGIPLRCWVWPGNTTDAPLIRQVRNDLRQWSLTRTIYAMDRGFTSRVNREELFRGGDGYIMGEKLRTAAQDVQHALATPGRFSPTPGGLKVKEVQVPPQLKNGPDDRFIVCYNPDEATKDHATRQRHLDQLDKMITDSDTLTEFDRGQLTGRITATGYLKKYLRITSTGRLRINKKAIATETRLDGKIPPTHQ
ncbi:IS1634 family transposase [Corynebacterium cystitidis]|uniref:IS1634 family transposase n=1 Tax=Corynebacterium cystitidis TaxID=35757 RepID=UPI00211DEE87|nr:IS1634 family transposase [Corynebacterium cystitidis]